jgi:hypothetical protein
MPSFEKQNLNPAIKTLKNVPDVERNQEIQKYLKKLSISETNYSPWKATKKLKRSYTKYLHIISIHYNIYQEARSKLGQK